MLLCYYHHGNIVTVSSINSRDRETIKNKITKYCGQPIVINPDITNGDFELGVEYDVYYEIELTKAYYDELDSTVVGTFIIIDQDIMFELQP